MGQHAMPKVIINTCYGGFGLSNEAKTILALRGVDVHSMDDDLRTNQDVVEVVELLGALANGDHSKLKVVDVPDDVKWHIAEYDGSEWVAEDHRTWG